MSSFSDLMAALEHVLALSSALPIASVNMSLGGRGFTDQASCDADMNNAMIKMAIDNLRSVGIATVIASGNEGFINALAAPGCISTAVSVGSTTKTDAISEFSNSASFLALLAPGESITSSIPGGGFGVKSGTSQATPHVAGAWAILKQSAPTATVSEVLTALQTTGLPILDTRNGVTTPRIRIFHALQALGGLRNKCPLDQGIWKNNPNAWPVTSLTLGSQTYTQAELLTLLDTPVRGDASLILAHQLIAAKLNIANGSNPTPIRATIADADRLLSGFAGKLPYNVQPSSAIGQQMVNDATVLDAYNNDELTPDCTP